MMETCNCGHTEVEHGSPPRECRTAPCRCVRYQSSLLTRAGEAATVYERVVRERDAALEALEEAQAEVEQVKEDRFDAAATAILLKRELVEAQGKLEAVRSLRYELAGGAGDLSWFVENLDRILRGSKEDE